MAGLAVVGMQWGDEGKGKIVDCLAEQCELIVRHQGGNNAGHTVFTAAGKFVFHLLPSGILHPGKTCLIGYGVVINPQVLCQEIRELQARGGTVAPENFRLSPNAHLILPDDPLTDRLNEKGRGEKAIGTTGRGIGPAYANKINRTGCQVGDLVWDSAFETKFRQRLERSNQRFQQDGGIPPVDIEAAWQEWQEYRDLLRPLVAEVSPLINQALSEGRRVLFECAQGTFLDIDVGTYPYVTSSCTTAGGICTGAGVAPHRIGQVLGVAKAYTTRVGSGPFPTEVFGPEAEAIRNAGPVGEYGATTGRPRRCGWLDLPLLRKAVMVNGVTGIALTRLDILQGWRTIPVCTQYRYRGETLPLAPEWSGAWAELEPVLEEWPGWQEPEVSAARQFDDLPAGAQSYVRRIEEQLGVPVEIISVGPQRAETIYRRPLFAA